jgi:hypothetical protein
MMLSTLIWLKLDLKGLKLDVYTYEPLPFEALHV